MQPSPVRISLPPQAPLLKLCPKAVRQCRCLYCFRHTAWLAAVDWAVAVPHGDLCSGRLRDREKGRHMRGCVSGTTWGCRQTWGTMLSGKKIACSLLAQTAPHPLQLVCVHLDS